MKKMIDKSSSSLIIFMFLLMMKTLSYFCYFTHVSIQFHHVLTITISGIKLPNFKFKGQVPGSKLENIQQGITII